MGTSHYGLKSFWQGASSSVLLNPRLSSSSRQKLIHSTAGFGQDETLWLQSSGTESLGRGEMKLIALSRESILSAADSVNRTFDLSSKDVWLNPLPTFHIGGLSIYARAYLTGSQVVEVIKRRQWCPSLFVEQIRLAKVSVTSLVPTQVYDLVDEKMKAPKSLRLVFVGGGALNSELYSKAKQLGWPLQICYGMTETAAQIATSRAAKNSLELPAMELLPHVDAKINLAGRLKLRSRAVARGSLCVGASGIRWTPFHGTYTTDDKIELQGRSLKVLGRSDQLIKILGETVNLRYIEEKAENFFSRPGRVAIFAKENQRRGFDLFAALEGEFDRLHLEKFNQSVEPFYRIQRLIPVENLPRNNMGKIIRSELPAFL